MSRLSEFERWCTRIDTIAWRVSRGEHDRVGELGDLSDEVIRLAPGLSNVERAEALARLKRAATTIADAAATVREQIDTLPARRRAARQYVASPQPVGAGGR